MSDKHELTLADFDAHNFWTWDEVADNGSLVPVAEIPLCHNGEIDLGSLFLRSRCKSSDDRQWNAIIGVRPSDFSVYWIQVFGETGHCAWNLNLPCDPADAIAFKETFGDNLGGVFPLSFKFQIAALGQTIAAEIRSPF